MSPKVQVPECRSLCARNEAKRSFHALMRALFFLLAFSSSLFAAKTNVLLIMADDLRDFGGAYTRDVVV